MEIQQQTRAQPGVAISSRVRLARGGMSILQEQMLGWMDRPTDPCIDLHDERLKSYGRVKALDLYFEDIWIYPESEGVYF